MENPVQLTPRFTEAVDYARQVHVSLRKGTQVPYMAHLIGVASNLPDEEKRKALAARRYAPDYRAVYSTAERIIDLARPIVGGSN